MKLSAETDSVRLTIEPNRFVFDRWEFDYEIEVKGSDVTVKGSDLRSGCMARDSWPNMGDMLGSLCNFATDKGSWTAEQWEILEMVTDEISVISLELEGVE